MHTTPGTVSITLDHESMSYSSVGPDVEEVAGLGGRRQGSMLRRLGEVCLITSGPLELTHGFR